MPSPVIDDERHTTYRKISWADFLDAGGRAKELQRQHERAQRSVAPASGSTSVSSVSAWLYSVVKVDDVDIVAEPIEDGGSRGRWRARPLRYRVYALMDKRASGVVPGTADALTLDHEQGHFDLAELCARRFRHEVALFEATGRSAAAAQQRLVDLLGKRHAELGRRFRLMQQRYDGETEHAQKARAQQKWRRKLDRWLRQEVPQTCTG